MKIHLPEVIVINGHSVATRAWRLQQDPEGHGTWHGYYVWSFKHKGYLTAIEGYQDHPNQTSLEKVETRIIPEEDMGRVIHQVKYSKWVFTDRNYQWDGVEIDPDTMIVVGDQARVEHSVLGVVESIFGLQGVGEPHAIFEYTDDTVHYEVSPEEAQRVLKEEVGNLTQKAWLWDDPPSKGGMARSKP